MSLEQNLSQLAKDVTPSSIQRKRIEGMIMKRIMEPPILRAAKKHALPTMLRRAHIWRQISDKIAPESAITALDRLKEILTPSQEKVWSLRLWLMPKLSPVPATTPYRPIKWIAAAAVFVIVARMSPMLFLAPQTVAESQVTLVPTRGEVSISLQGFMQPVSDEIPLHQGAKVATEDGEATVILHDDGNVRLAAQTNVEFHDLSDRPKSSQEGPTLTLQEGQMWVQGLLPSHLQGIVIATPHGNVTVHAGSVSIVVDDGAAVQVWDRHAEVELNGVKHVLVMGERIRLRDGTMSSVTRISPAQFDESWPVQNLQRDAVHQREIAQLQRERRAANAGILPTSPLYPVKRVAERVDVLLTLNHESKVQKRLQQAETRLNEAAALIAEDDGTGATLPLQEYKETLLAVATGSGGDNVTSQLLQQEIAENTAELAAALPADDGYILKKAVLEASVEIPASNIDEEDVEGTILVETLDSLQDAAKAGDRETVEKGYAEIEPYMESLSEDSLKPEIKKEALSLLKTMEVALEDSESGSGSQTSVVSSQPLPPKPTYVPLTDKQLNTLVQRILERVNIYDSARGRSNQLFTELHRVRGHSDEGRILRVLFDSITDPEHSRYVRAAIQELRKEKREE